MSPSSRRRLRWLAVVGTILIYATFKMRALNLDSLEQRLAGPPVAQPQRTTEGMPRSQPDYGPASLEEFLNFLATRRGRDLHNILERLDGYAEQLGLSNDQIDRVLEEVRRIEADDPYQEMEWPGKMRHDPEKGHLVYGNRRAATGAIEVLGFRKLANPLRSLPLEERVAKVIEFKEGRADVGGYPGHGSSWFGGELWRIGKDAVPFILRRAEEAPEFRLSYIRTLSQIGDPRGIDFIVQSLREAPAEDTSLRCEIIQWLSAFRGERVVEALIESMQDRVRSLGDARPTQRPQPSHELHPVRFYPVRMCAARALSTVTEKHWGFLFNEDPGTWVAWHDADDRAGFDPVNLPRSDEELAAEVENFTYRCMMEFMRSEGWAGAFGDVAYAMKQDVNHLQKLGPRVVPLLVQTTRTINAEFPVWEKDLRHWTRKLLTAMGTPDSLGSAAELAD